MFTSKATVGAASGAGGDRAALLEAARKGRAVRQLEEAAGLHATKLQSWARMALTRMNTERAISTDVNKKLSDLNVLGALLRSKGVAFSPPAETLMKLSGPLLLAFGRHCLRRSLSQEHIECCHTFCVQLGQSCVQSTAATNVLLYVAARDGNDFRTNLRRLAVAAASVCQRVEVPPGTRAQLLAMIARLVGQHPTAPTQPLAAIKAGIVQALVSARFAETAARAVLLSVPTDITLSRLLPLHGDVDACRAAVAICLALLQSQLAACGGDSDAAPVVVLTRAVATHVMSVPFLLQRCGAEEALPGELWGAAGELGEHYARALALLAQLLLAAAPSPSPARSPLPAWSDLLAAATGRTVRRQRVAPGAAAAAAASTAATTSVRASTATSVSSTAALASSATPPPMAAAALKAATLSTFGMFGLGAAAPPSSAKPSAAAAAATSTAATPVAALPASAAAATGAAAAATASVFAPLRRPALAASAAYALLAWPAEAYLLGNVAQLLSALVAVPTQQQSQRPTAAAAVAGTGASAPAAAPVSTVVFAATLEASAAAAALRLVRVCMATLPDDCLGCAAPVIWVAPLTSASAAMAAAPATAAAAAWLSPAAKAAAAPVPVPMPPLLVAQLRALSGERVAKALARVCCALPRPERLRCARLRMPDEEDPELRTYDAYVPDVAATGHQATASVTGGGAGGGGGGSGTTLAAPASIVSTIARNVWETSKLAVAWFRRRRPEVDAAESSGSSAAVPLPVAAVPTTAAAASPPAAQRYRAGGYAALSAVDDDAIENARSSSSPAAVTPSAAPTVRSSASASSSLTAFDAEAMRAFTAVYAQLTAPRPSRATGASGGGLSVSSGGTGLAADAEPIVGRLHLLNGLAYSPHLRLVRSAWAWVNESTGDDLGAFVRAAAYKGCWRLSSSCSSPPELALPAQVVDTCAALTLFAALLGHFLPVADEAELYARHTPLPLRELRVVVRLLRDVLVHAEGIGAEGTTKLAAALGGAGAMAAEARLRAPATADWSRFAAAASGVLRQLYDRHSQRPLGPQSMWLVDCARVTLTFPAGSHRHAAPSAGGRAPSDYEEAVQRLLRLLPFAVPFETRAAAYEAARAAEVVVWQTARPQVGVVVRRAALFDTALAALAPVRGDALRRKLAVSFVNAEGLPEAGIDAGGLFKELWTSLAAVVFDPAFGLFRLNEAGELYPNPASELATGMPDAEAFDLVGRLVGKALFEGVTLGPQFARFFLLKLLGRPVHVHHLPSLDAELYRSLMFLKTCDAAVVPELALAFTVAADLGLGVDASGGSDGEIELVPGGRNVAVTASNRLRYIHLLADWRLNASIGRQCAAFVRGLRDVLPLEWLGPFSAPELQVLLSGSQRGVDAEDMQAHAVYSGGYWAHDGTVRALWAVVAELAPADRAALMRFVTAAERPPPNGFRQLHPPFTVMRLPCARPDEALPMASTCFNTLKLPAYSSKAVLKAKLLQAIHSGAGFEMS